MGAYKLRAAWSKYFPFLSLHQRTKQGLLGETLGTLIAVPTLQLWQGLMSHNTTVCDHPRQNQPTISRPKKFFSSGLIRNLQYLKHLGSDSGADRTYHARDTAGRARTGTRIEILKNAMFWPAHFSVYASLDRRDAVSWVEMDCRQKEWSKEVSKEKYLSYVAL